MMPFVRNPKLDGAAIARALSEHGHVHVPDFLKGDQAAVLADHLRNREDWRVHINGGDKVFDAKRSDYDAMDAADRGRIEAAINAAARDGFQFRFDSIRVPDEVTARRDSASMLTSFAEFMSAPAQCAFFERMLSRPVRFADAQATRYGSGDFLTCHDDDVAGKDRVAAYVLGLTDGWRAEWGGLLAFHDENGHIERAYTPRANSLNLFLVPRAHSVTMVTPFAAYPRLSVTGWLRAVSPPAALSL